MWPRNWDAYSSLVSDSPSSVSRGPCLSWYQFCIGLKISINARYIHHFKVLFKYIKYVPMQNLYPHCGPIQHTGTTIWTQLTALPEVIIGLIMVLLLLKYVCPNFSHDCIYQYKSLIPYFGPILPRPRFDQTWIYISLHISMTN